MKKQILVPVILMFSFLALAPAAPAVPALIYGHVYDWQHNPAPDIPVHVFGGPGGAFNETVVTGPTGYYQVDITVEDGLGTYWVSVNPAYSVVHVDCWCHFFGGDFFLPRPPRIPQEWNPDGEGGGMLSGDDDTPNLSGSGDDDQPTGPTGDDDMPDVSE